MLIDRSAVRLAVGVFVALTSLLSAPFGSFAQGAPLGVERATSPESSPVARVQPPLQLSGDEGGEPTSGLTGSGKMRLSTALLLTSSAQLIRRPQAPTRSSMPLRPACERLPYTPNAPPTLL